MRRAAAMVVASMTAATIFFATPAQAKPLCWDAFGVCDKICRWGIAC